MKLRAFALPVALLACASCAGRGPAALTDGEAAALDPDRPARQVRILTINVWSGLTYRGTLSMGRHPDDPVARYAALVAGIKELAPDIIAVQEANPLPGYAERLAADLAYSVVHRVALGGIRLGPVGIPWNLREGDAVLVKPPSTLVELGARRLAGRGIVTNWGCLHVAETTQALLCRTVVNGKPLYVYNVHLHSGPFRGPALDEALERLRDERSPDEVASAASRVEEDISRRAREIARLRGFVEDTLPPGAPAVLLGDFNTPPESGELAPLTADGQWVDSFGLATAGTDGSTRVPEGNPNYRGAPASAEPYDVLRSYHAGRPSRIDLILLNEAIGPDRVVSSRVVLTPVDGVCPSDHYGVLTTLSW